MSNRNYCGESKGFVSKITREIRKQVFILTRPLRRFRGLGVTLLFELKWSRREKSDSSSGLSGLFPICCRTREKSGSSVTFNWPTDCGSGGSFLWLDLMWRTRASDTSPFRQLYAGETNIPPDLFVEERLRGAQQSGSSVGRILCPLVTLCFGEVSLLGVGLLGTGALLLTE